MNITITLDDISKYMRDNIEFLSPSDISKKYGKTRQYWEKLMKLGKLWSQQTKAGKITTNKHLEEYFQTRKRNAPFSKV